MTIRFMALSSSSPFVEICRETVSYGVDLESVFSIANTTAGVGWLHACRIRSMSPGSEAWHEAGHALAAHLLGGVVREVTLESESDDFEGHVAVEWSSAAAGEEARRLATVALAGPVAELVFRGEDVLVDPGVLLAWRGDWDEADAQLARLHADAPEREEARRAILRELHGFFDEAGNYERLARLADALDAHVTLDEALFAEALG